MSFFFSLSHLPSLAISLLSLPFPPTLPSYTLPPTLSLLSVSLVSPLFSIPHPLFLTSCFSLSFTLSSFCQTHSLSSISPPPPFPSQSLSFPLSLLHSLSYTLSLLSLSPPFPYFTPSPLSSQSHSLTPPVIDNLSSYTLPTLVDK